MKRVESLFVLSLGMITQSTFSQVREFFIYIHPDSLYILYSRSIWDNTWIPMRFVSDGSQYLGEIRFKGHIIPADSNDYYRCYEKKFPADSNYSDLIQLIREINETPVENFHEFIDQRFFSESVINWFVLNTITHMGDTYNKNYYLYHDSTTDKWLIIPWDYDLSFGRDGDSALPYPINLLSDKFKYWYMLPYHGVDNPLKTKFFQNSTLVNRFKQRLDSVLANVFTEEKMKNLIDHYYQLIKSYVYIDEFKWGTNSEFEEQVEALRYYVTARRHFLYKWLSNFWPGNINEVSLRIDRIDTVYHFVDKIGRLLCSMWFYEVQGLDSITVIVYPDSIHSYLPAEVSSENKFVKRVFKFIPYPENARFRVKVRIEYKDQSTRRTEVMPGVIDERFLKLHRYDGNSWHQLETYINSYGNFAVVDNLTEMEMNQNNSFVLFIPVDYKRRWKLVETYTWDKLNRVRFFNRNIGYIVGETSRFFLTTDGGNSWLQKSFGVEIALNDVDFTDSLVFFVGNQGLVYKGRIGDTILTKVSLNTREDLKSVKFYKNSSYGFISGDSLYYTRDGGNTWTKLNWKYGYETDIFSVDTFLSVNGNEIIMWGTGSTNVNRFTISQDTTVKLYKIKCFEPSFVVAISDDSVYIVNFISGDIRSSALGLRVKVNDIKIIDTSKIFLACDDGVILYSNDSGRRWNIQPTGVRRDIYSIDFVDSLNGWATGIFGLILSTNQGGIVKVDDKIISYAPSKFKLYQNYSNPFNSSTRITFELPYETYVELEVYDVLGRKVGKIFEGYKSAGLHYIDFNAEALSSGVYFYKLKAGGRMLVGKMMLVK